MGKIFTLDGKMDKIFIMLVDKCSNITLANIAAICQYNSKTIEFKLGNSDEYPLSISILTEIVRGWFKHKSPHRHNHTIESYYNIAQFIEKYVKPEPILAAVKRGSCINDFEQLIDSFFLFLNVKTGSCLKVRLKFIYQDLIFLDK